MAVSLHKAWGFEDVTWTAVSLAVGLCGLILGGVAAAAKRSRASVLSSTASRNPPGPKGWPLIGHIFDLLSPNFHLKFTHWANQYGGLYSLQLPGQRIFVVSDPSLAGPLIARGQQALPKAAFVYASPGLMQTVTPSRAHNIFNEVTQTPYWKHVRKTLATAFSMDSIRKQFPDILKHASHLTRKWDDLLQNSERTIHVEPWAKQVALDLIGDLGFGVQFGALDGGDKYRPYLKAVDATLGEACKRFTNPLREHVQRLLPFTAEARDVTAAQRLCYELYANMLATIRQRPAPDEQDTSLAACLTRLQTAAGDGPMDDAHVLSNLGVMIVAGYDTNAGTLSWLLYDIARNPEVQQRLKDELAAAGLLGSGARQLQWSDLLGLPYLNAVMKESMRLHFITGFSVVRQADRDLVLDGVLVHKGDVVWVPIYTIQKSRHNFVEPERFWPERWEYTDPEALPPGLRQGAATPAGHAQALRSSFLPFGDGPADCIGQNQAMAIQRTLLITLLSRFWFEVDWDKMGSHERVEEEQVIMGTVWTKGGIHLKVRPHGVTGSSKQ